MLTDVEQYTLIISLAALLAAGASAAHARNANRISSMQHWMQLLLGYIDRELKACDEDHQVFKQLCKLPMSGSRKEALVRQLATCRDEGHQRLYGLAILAPETEHLAELRRQRDRVWDSYFDNQEPILPSALAEDLYQRYRSAAHAYAAAVREAARTISRNAWVDDPMTWREKLKRFFLVWK